MTVDPKLLFPTPIWSLKAHSSLLESFPRIINKIQKDCEHGFINSNYNKSNKLGFQSPRYGLLGNPYLTRQDSLSFRRTLQDVVGIPEQDVIQVWVNCGYASSYNIPHIHHSSMLSGVLYLKVPDGSGSIVFKDPRPQSTYSALYNNNFSGDTWYLKPLAKIAPFEGQILLFPSWLEHSVESGDNQSDLRISMPFNIASLL